MSWQGGCAGIGSPDLPDSGVSSNGGKVSEKPPIPGTSRSGYLSFEQELALTDSSHDVLSRLPEFHRDDAGIDLQISSPFFLIGQSLGGGLALCLGDYLLSQECSLFYRHSTASLRTKRTNVSARESLGGSMCLGSVGSYVGGRWVVQTGRVLKFLCR